LNVGIEWVSYEDPNEVETEPKSIETICIYKRPINIKNLKFTKYVLETIAPVDTDSNDFASEITYIEVRTYFFSYILYFILNISYYICYNSIKGKW
jgi:hypothetical protein